MKKYLSVFFVFVLLISCKQNENAGIKGFHDVPIEMQEDGAGCLFAADQKKLDKGEYLLVTDYDSTAYIFLNGQMTRFMLAEFDFNESTQDLKQTYKSGDYTLRVNVKHTGGLDESTEYKGEMTVEGKDGKIISKKMVGSCGA